MNSRRFIESGSWSSAAEDELQHHGVQRMISGGSSDEQHSSGDASPNREHPVDYNNMEIAGQHQPRRTRRQPWTEAGPNYEQPIHIPPSSSPALRTATTGRVRTFTNPSGMGSRDFNQCRSSRLRDLHSQGTQHTSVVPDATNASSVADGTEGTWCFPCHGSEEHPRHSKQRKQTGTWSNETLKGALSAVDDGSSIRSAASQFGIPYSSFRDWCFGVHSSRKRGPPPTLNSVEEQQIVDYLVTMSEMGYGLTPTAFKLKVYEITRGRYTPFRNGIPGRGWMRCWNARHPELALRVAQALEAARAQGLTTETTSSFYNNLETLYKTHAYSADRIWNCDETGTQAGRNGGAHVIARRGARNVHSVVPDKREWMSILVCVNAAGASIPLFYIFRGKRFRQNYISKCEAGATMAMQQKAWMMCFLFSTWISHFIRSVQQLGGISNEQRHLLILDGHSSHVNMEVIGQAKSAGLDLLTLPSHTSHALQPLDCSVFKPFKGFFRAYRDYWSRRNVGVAPSKQTLAQWVSLALRQALSEKNIKAGFRGTCIFPLHRQAVDRHLQPSTIYQQAPIGTDGTAMQSQTTLEPCIVHNETLIGSNGSSVILETTSQPVHSTVAEAGSYVVVHDLDNASTDPILDCASAGTSTVDIDTSEPYVVLHDPDSASVDPVIDCGSVDTSTANIHIAGVEMQNNQTEEQSLQNEEIEAHLGEEHAPTVQHFFVAFNPANPDVPEEMVPFDAGWAAADSMTSFLTLPSLTPRVSNKQRDPLLDFTKSIMLTSDEYIAAAEASRLAKVEAAKEKEKLRQEKEERRNKKLADREEERRDKEARATELAEARAAKAQQREEARIQRHEAIVARTADKAKRAAERAESQRLKVLRATERARRPEEQEVNIEDAVNDAPTTYAVTSPFPPLNSSGGNQHSSEPFLASMYSTLPSLPDRTLPYMIPGMHSSPPMCLQPVRPQPWATSASTSVLQGALPNVTSAVRSRIRRATDPMDVHFNVPEGTHPGWQPSNPRW